MKTAFKLTEYTDGRTGNTAGIFENLEEAESAIPSGFTAKKIQPDDNTPHFQITEFTYPDMIADIQKAWEYAEIIKTFHYYK